jgi:hypothetical protein
MAAAHDRTEPARPLLRWALRASAVVELATGLAVLAAPYAVVDVLIGSQADSATAVVARLLGAALLALGMAGRLAGATPGVALAFVSYNVVATVILVMGGLDGSADGSLLWPAAVLHASASAALITGALRTASPHPDRRESA